MALPLTQPLLLIIAAVLCSTSAQNDVFWKDSYDLGYTYEQRDEQNGPSQWSKISSQSWGEWQDVNVFVNQNMGLIEWPGNQCGSEARPSPIEVTPNGQCGDSLEMRVRQFNPNTDCHHPLEGNNPDPTDTDPWEITPYSLRWYMPRNDSTCLRPTLRLDGIQSLTDSKSDEHFVLLWLELHARSEHMIDGRRYDAELQMVHMGTTRPNELVIVSVMIEAGNVDEDNVDFQKYLLDGWQLKAQKEAQTCSSRNALRRTRRHLRKELRTENSYLAALQEYQLEMGKMEVPRSAFDERELQGGGNANNCVPDKYGMGCQQFGLGPRRRMFPYNLWPSIWYYSYPGSLTAPPCTGLVHWRIIDTPL